jgi:hypothetical protein
VRLVALRHLFRHRFLRCRNGKAAGERCVQLDTEGLCKIFGQPERPAVCSSLKATASMCGANASEAMAYLTELERLTV